MTTKVILIVTFRIPIIRNSIIRDANAWELSELATRCPRHSEFKTPQWNAGNTPWKSRALGPGYLNNSVSLNRPWIQEREVLISLLATEK